MSYGYDMLYAGAAVLSSPLWLWRMARSGKWRTDWPARFGVVRNGRASTDPARPHLLIHAVSVGEVNVASAIATQLEQLTSAHSGGRGWRITISATTDTGIARAQQLMGERHTVVRYPLDFGVCVERFLDAVQPDLVALVELEVWPNFVRACERRGVPICVVNGRLSARSFRGYRLGRPVLRSTFSRLAAVAAQTRRYADRFIALGTPAGRVRVIDSVKWDSIRVNSAPVPHEAAALAGAMGLDRSRPVVVAGSTGPGEEKLLIEALPQWPQQTQLVLVPRRPERFDEVAQLARHVVRRSHYPDGTRRPLDDSRLFLIDTMGELTSAYALADVALIGRSFLGLHGSNPIESVVLGKPTIIGPHHEDFEDMVDALAQGGGIIITDAPGQEVTRLLDDAAAARALAEKGLAVIRQRHGATARQAQMLVELMPAQVTAAREATTC